MTAAQAKKTVLQRFPTASAFKFVNRICVRDNGPEELPEYLDWYGRISEWCRTEGDAWKSAAGRMAAPQAEEK